ncbi:hypothetical protein HGRIS_007732 [Hohenbuehelia grisea]|uniref:Tubulin-tyrosine ligase n=1 Tax=Hohenbuehelia grisea TaxID=104357 RepID=A0ABR3J679_9AGAR
MHAVVSWPSAPLTDSLVRKALGSLDVPIEIVTSVPDSYTKLLQWSTYDDIDHERVHNDSRSTLSSSYVIRKSLIRKHFLSRCLHSYLVKHPQSLLRNHVPRTWDLDIAFADELDEALADDLWELSQELEGDKWWILKPGMADRGMGIRLFNTRESLEAIFEEFEPGSDDEDDDGEAENDTAVITSQLRHFVIQEYLATPLLIDPTQVPLDGGIPPSSLHGHKFHLRAYVVCSGALTVYLYPRVLALFSAMPYVSPTAGDGGTSSIDLGPHLTNTSLQTHRGEEGVRLLDELIGCSVLSHSGDQSDWVLSAADVENIRNQMAEVLAETFKAALENPIHFQPLPNAFELFGIDFLVDQSPAPSGDIQVKLLEINAEPAIELTGPRLTWILQDLFTAMAKVCVTPFCTDSDLAKETWAVGDTKHGLVKCFEQSVRGPA